MIQVLKITFPQGAGQASDTWGHNDGHGWVELFEGGQIKMIIVGMGNHHSSQGGQVLKVQANRALSLHHTDPITENRVGEDESPVYFHQDCGMTHKGNLKLIHMLPSSG